MNDNLKVTWADTMISESTKLRVKNVVYCISNVKWSNHQWNEDDSMLRKVMTSSCIIHDSCRAKYFLEDWDSHHYPGQGRVSAISPRHSLHNALSHITHNSKSFPAKQIKHATKRRQIWGTGRFWGLLMHSLIISNKWYSHITWSY